MRAIHVLAVLLGFLILVGCPSGDDDDSVGDDDAGDDDVGPVDQDGDGFDEDEDCDDQDAGTYPGAVELCDDLDNDCDGVVDEEITDDVDGDGWDICSGDCDDIDTTIRPGAMEIPYDGIDQDCDGHDVVDMDRDGHLASEVGGDDCDDRNALVYPTADELCDGLDGDCDGDIPSDELVDADGDGSPICRDCNDADPSVFPGHWEAPNDGIDSDCDGRDTTDLVQAATWIIGHDVLEYPGHVFPAGDVDDDGVDDVLVGSTSCGQPGCAVDHSMGYILLFGRGLEPLPVPPGILESKGNLQCSVVMNESNQPGVAATSGDVDGDGKTDILLQRSPGQTSSLYLGSRFHEGGFFLPEAADASFVPNEHALLGWYTRTSISSGDIDGDGTDDLVLSQPHGPLIGGSVHVYLGDTVLSAAVHDVGIATDDATLIGEAGQSCGSSVAANGDVDGDDRDDILIGCEDESHLVFGSSVPIGDLLSLSAADATILGTGEAVALLGDVDGDDLDDLLVGGDHLFFGQTVQSGGVFDLLEADVVFLEEDGADLHQAATAGDVDGDGLDDILFGAPNYEEDGEEPGKIYLVRGSTIGGGGNFDLAHADFAFVGPIKWVNSHGGRSVSTAGDVDGDGRDDIMIGAFGSAFLLISPL